MRVLSSGGSCPELLISTSSRTAAASNDKTLARVSTVTCGECGMKVASPSACRQRSSRSPAMCSTRAGILPGARAVPQAKPLDPPVDRLEHPRTFLVAKCCGVHAFKAGQFHGDRSHGVHLMLWGWEVLAPVRVVAGRRVVHYGAKHLRNRRCRAAEQRAILNPRRVDVAGDGVGP